MKQRKDEKRIDYLMRVLHEFMNNTIAGDQAVEYDGVVCDGHCLASDIAGELGIVVEE